MCKISLQTTKDQQTIHPKNYGHILFRLTTENNDRRQQQQQHRVLFSLSVEIWLQKVKIYLQTRSINDDIIYITNIFNRSTLSQINSH